MGGKQKPYEMWQAGNSLAASPLANSSRASPERNIAALPPLARSRIPPATQASPGVVVTLRFPPKICTRFRETEVPVHLFACGGFFDESVAEYKTLYVTEDADNTVSSRSGIACGKSRSNRNFHK